MEPCVWRMAGEAIAGGAVALRIEGLANIARVSEFSSVPIIGLVKTLECGTTHITRYCDTAKEIMDAGATYVAADARGKYGYDELFKMINSGFPVIGDISTAEEAILAEDAGCIAVTTALAGYTERCQAHEFDPPDIELVRKCSVVLTIRVIAEGRYFTNEQVREAYDAGAYAVCIGGAITLPDKITRRFAEVQANV